MPIDKIQTRQVSFCTKTFDIKIGPSKLESLSLRSARYCGLKEGENTDTMRRLEALRRKGIYRPARNAGRQNPPILDSKATPSAEKSGLPAVMQVKTSPPNPVKLNTSSRTAHVQNHTGPGFFVDPYDYPTPDGDVSNAYSFGALY